MAVILACFTTVLSAVAGSFTTDFNSGLPAGARVYGSALVDKSGGPDKSGCLKLTTNAGNQLAGFILNDLDRGAMINGFKASFQLYLAHNGPAADGVSFNFGDMRGVATIAQTGAGRGLTVEFHTYDFSEFGAGICLYWDGVPFKTNKMRLATGTWVPVTIQLNPNGALSLTHDSHVIFSDVPTPFKPMPGQFGIGARTGGVSENAWIDNLTITTTQPPAGEQKRLAAAAKALAWNQSQAEAGDAYGQFRMGERYRDGDGVKKDLDNARQMFQAAAAQGNSDAAAALSRLPPSISKPK